MNKQERDFRNGSRSQSISYYYHNRSQTKCFAKIVPKLCQFSSQNN
ncbi:hypothetical protein [Bacillus sp. TH007]|nr:hypothetical protein [Bacillus sp. TH007]